MNLIPERNQRAVFIGPTGSGKTYLARRLLESLGDDYIVVDPKRQWEPPSNIEARIVVNRKQLDAALTASARDGQPIIYRPSKAEVSSGDWSGPCDYVASRALERRHTTLYYDELAYVASGSDFRSKAPNYYYAITTGRSLGVGVWGSVQRPAWIPRIALTESDYRYTFYLRSESDRSTVEGLMGDGVSWDRLRRIPYSWYCATDVELVGPRRIG